MSSNHYLPQIQAQYSNVIKLVHGGVMSVLWVVDLGVDPGSLVVRVVNLFGFPLTLHRQHERVRVGDGTGY